MSTTTDFITSSSREYSIYVCKSRGIPSISDGLKDAQRKALDVIKPMSDKIKTISLAGTMISSNKYLHGDAAACDTISLMAAPYCNNIPLLSGIGAFGTRVGPDNWGAPRYTYVKKNVYTENLIYQDFDIIPLKENYDGSVMEPLHFLPLIPVVLLNGVSGIAVGWSTEILPRNFNELIDATVAAIDEKKKLPELLPCYDFLHVKTNALGENQYEFFGKAAIDGSSVVVTELPPDLSLEKFKARLNKFEEEELIQGYVDRSTKEIYVEVRFKRGSIADWSVEQAIDFLKLKTKNTERLVLLDYDGKNIKQFTNVHDLIRDFVNWRLKFYKVRFDKLIQDTTHELNWNLALKACYDHNLPGFLMKAKNKQEIIEKISKFVGKIDITEEQKDRIAGLPSYRWAEDQYHEVINKISELKNTLTEYNSVVSSPEKLRAIYRAEVLHLKKLPKVQR
jgi:DNA gyrase/topoisomerase IV subunit A